MPVSTPIWEEVPEGDESQIGHWSNILMKLKSRPGQWARVWGPELLADGKEHKRLSHYIRKQYDEFDAIATTLKERDKNGNLQGVIHAVFMNEEQKKDKELRKSKYGKR